jgi:hypothetical protein
MLHKLAFSYYNLTKYKDNANSLTKLLNYFKHAKFLTLINIVRVPCM